MHSANEYMGSAMTHEGHRLHRRSKSNERPTMNSANEYMRSAMTHGSYSPADTPGRRSITHEGHSILRRRRSITHHEGHTMHSANEYMRSAMTHEHIRSRITDESYSPPEIRMHSANEYMRSAMTHEGHRLHLRSKANEGPSMNSANEYMRSAMTHGSYDYSPDITPDTDELDYDDVVLIRMEGPDFINEQYETDSDADYHHVSLSTIDHNEDPTALGAKTKLETILKQLRLDPLSNDGDGSQLRPATKDFLQNTLSYIDCRAKMDDMYRKIDESQTLAHYPLQSCTATIQKESDDPNEYKPEYQQQSTTGKPVQSLDELYAMAEPALPVFREHLERICEICGDQNGSVQLMVAPLKARERALEKARDDYSQRIPGPGVSWLYDIVRGSLLFDSAEQLVTCLDLIRNDPTLQIVKAKNRFQSPSLSGYRDVNLHIRIPVQNSNGFHICEVQLHHNAIRDLDKMIGSHDHYEYFRSYFAGSIDSVKDRVEDLKKIVGPGGGGLNNDFLQDLIHTSNSIQDESRLQRLGTLFRKQLCEYSWALHVYCKLLQLQLDHYGVRHLSVLKSCNALAIVLSDIEDFEKAEQMYELSIDLLLGNESSNRQAHSLLAQIFNNMSTLLTQQKRLGKAKELHRKSLDIYKKTLGETHVHVANLYFNMGVILKKEKLGHHFHHAAMVNYQKALAIYKFNYGEEHPKVASTYNNMARILHERKKFGESIGLYEDCLKIYKKTVGDDHSSVGNTYNNIGLVRSSQGNLEEAVVAFEKSVEIFKKNFGEGHSKVADGYSNMKNVLERLYEDLMSNDKRDKAMEWKNWAKEKHQLAIQERHVMYRQVYRFRRRPRKWWEIKRKWWEIKVWEILLLGILITTLVRLTVTRGIGLLLRILATILIWFTAATRIGSKDSRLDLKRRWRSSKFVLEKVISIPSPFSMANLMIMMMKPWNGNATVPWKGTSLSSGRRGFRAKHFASVRQKTRKSMSIVIAFYFFIIVLILL